jgi:hypothetical protein
MASATWIARGICVVLKGGAASTLVLRVRLPEC